MASAKRSKSKASTPRKQAEVMLRSGQVVPLDGDLVFLIDAVYRDLAVKSGFATGYAAVQKEIGSLLGQMDDKALSEYFAASLFLNYVTYENEMAERLTEAIAAKAKRAARR